MKRILFMVVVLGFLFAGCSNEVTQSEYWHHGSQYKDFNHMMYSWFGYKQPTKETGQESEKQNWWGIPVEHQE